MKSFDTSVFPSLVNDVEGLIKYEGFSGHKL